MYHLLNNITAIGIILDIQIKVIASTNSACPGRKCGCVGSIWEGAIRNGS
jgi:hypothetical protein